MDAETATLVNGPQDGARVTIGAGMLPPEIHVGPKWLGDGFAAWSREACERFPCVYLWDGVYLSGERRRFLFSGWQTDPDERPPADPCRG